MSENHKFKEYLDLYRKATGMYIPDLVKKTGISQRSFYYWLEDESRIPSGLYMYTLKKELGPHVANCWKTENDTELAFSWKEVMSFLVKKKENEDE